MEGLRSRLSIVALGLGLAFLAKEPVAHADDASAFDTRIVEPVRFEPRAPAVDPSELVAAPDVELDRWKGMSFGSYLAPKRDLVDGEGGFDVVFHFHAGQMTEKQLRESGLNAVFVSCGFGIGSGAYADAFADPSRFERMLAELTKNIEKDTGRRGLHIRKLALASWSAGFAAVGKILGVDKYYGMIDAVVLNDSLHSSYKGTAKTAQQGEAAVNLDMIKGFVRFAKDAAQGKKAMVITHSSIIPPDYASSAEATTALLGAIDVPIQTTSETNARGMTMGTRADAGALHVRGFRGRGPRDHFDHLYLIGEALRSWVVPRWKRTGRLVYTLAGEQR